MPKSLQQLYPLLKPLPVNLPAHKFPVAIVTVKNRTLSPIVERVEALNHALRGIPEDRVRYHVCFGSWHVPHVADAPLESIVDLIIRVRAGAYSIEAANVRHEHEWRVWETVRLPAGKILIPGVVTHHTTTVEHPRLVADRIVRFARLVGRENVIAGTDCGFAQLEGIARVHPQVMWAKFESLVEGARLASRELWSR
jgi:5-methyltetrahydropteroyltriglutamate--homocysteine methyltransferase